ncbi:sigma-54 interaction domain-containing protein [Chitinophaga sp. NPDC101104]|uniref:sigma-54-dependent Fis family transcriptional regulator n=1 Tax=Chitinophaga sp. NPDC101104 TaxID=3390561 RepID=UPI003D019C5A
MKTSTTNTAAPGRKTLMVAGYTNERPHFPELGGQISEAREQRFIPDFYSEIAAARSRNELSRALRNGMKGIPSAGGFLVQQVHSDQTTTNYIYDESLETVDSALVRELVTAKLPLRDGLQDRVLQSEIPLFFSVSTEIARGNDAPYLQIWKKAGIQIVTGTALRTGDQQPGILWLGVADIDMPLLQGICTHVSIAMSNITMKEELLRRETEAAFLHTFSREIAAIRTKDDLQSAISQVLHNVLNIRLAIIRTIDADGETLSPYLFDESMVGDQVEGFRSLMARKLDIHHPLSALVLQNGGPVVFNVSEEAAKGAEEPIVRFWESLGMEQAFGAPLRMGDTNIGTLWLLTNEVNMPVLNSICAQISIAISNILANEKLLAYKQQLENENDYLREQIKTIYDFSGIVGSGAQMQKVYRLITQVAASSSTVLLTGETGTGKELVARAVHNASPRKSRLMVKVNCAALPAHLIESELFGHEKGAFTGAIDRRIGKFELANNSTLFLDEIGEMPLELQVKLLRVLQERELERVGGKSTIKVDVRIIAATNRDLEAEVQAGRFRADLFYRLNVFPIHLPPLRERAEDIEPLANAFITKFSKQNGRKISGISAKVLKALKSYHWPGNVRELEHLVERAILLSEDATIREVHLPDRARPENEVALPHAAFPQTLEQIEKSYIIEVLKRCGGKISGVGGAAEVLELPGTTLHSKMKKLGILKADYFNN